MAPMPPTVQPSSSSRSGDRVLRGEQEGGQQVEPDAECDLTVAQAAEEGPKRLAYRRDRGKEGGEPGEHDENDGDADERRLRADVSGEHAQCRPGEEPGYSDAEDDSEQPCPSLPRRCTHHPGDRAGPCRGARHALAEAGGLEPEEGVGNPNATLAAP